MEIEVKLKSGKLVNIDGVNNVGSAGKSLPTKQDVDGRCGMECIPEHILIPLSAGHLEGQTCNLAAVSPDPTAPLVYHAEAVLGVVLEQILEHVADVDVGEPGTWEVGVKVGVLLGVVLILGGIIGEEIVVEVVIAAHSDEENAVRQRLRHVRCSQAGRDLVQCALEVGNVVFIFLEISKECMHGRNA
nr:hypothetical protein Iba_chr12bCG18420 [Ipomoea batatas]